MKLYKNCGWMLLAATIFLPGCFKKFDASSYAPELSIGGYTSSDEIAPANLIGHWSFDGDYKDAVSGTQGTNVGTSIVNGFKGQAMKGALNSYVLVDPSNDIKNMQSFTIGYWVNSPAPSAGIIGLVNLAKTDAFWGNIDMFFENEDNANNIHNRFRAHITNGAKDTWIAQDNITNLYNNWVHICVSYDGSSTFKFYLNGSVINTSTVADFGPIHFTNAGQMVFGCVQFQTDPSLTSATGSQPWASYLTGTLDEVRIYNTALSDDDINSLVKLEGRGK